MMAHAMDNSPPSTIILITGDRDFTYLISVLTARQYRVVVIVPSNHHSSLTYQASAVLDWDTQILGTPSKKVPSASSSSISPLVDTNLLLPPASYKDTQDPRAPGKYPSISAFAAPSDSAAQPALQPFTFPNTFPVAPSKQASDPSERVATLDFSPLVDALKQLVLDGLGSDGSSKTTPTEGDVDSTSTSTPPLTKKQIRLLKKGLKSETGTTNPFASTSGAQANENENENASQWRESSVAAPFQTTLSPWVASASPPTLSLKPKPNMTPTSRAPFLPFSEPSAEGSRVKLYYQSITAMHVYRGLSIEELRVDDYQEGRTRADVRSNIS